MNEDTSEAFKIEPDDSLIGRARRLAEAKRASAAQDKNANGKKNDRKHERGRNWENS